MSVVSPMPRTHKNLHGHANDVTRQKGDKIPERVRVNFLKRPRLDDFGCNGVCYFAGMSKEAPDIISELSYYSAS